MSAFTFTQLEALLLAALISFITGLGVRVWMGTTFITRRECRNHRALYRCVQRDLNRVFRMLCAVVAHMDNLTAEERERILKMYPSDFGKDDSDE